jgi:phosphatidylserine/phosphatidylglycerophosphate/cardiolipin synthase-like enzyme
MNRKALVLLGLLFPILGSSAAEAEEIGHTTVCFTLRGADCALPILGAIAGARRTLEVQAYNFTEPRIIAAIVAAHARGVAVTVVLDKVSPHQQGEGADPVHDAGIPTYIDYAPKIAHNKVMIVDDATVVTGSFNFTVSADTKNAENVLILRDPDLAKAYDENFHIRLNASEPYNPAHAEGPRVGIGG